VAKYAFQFGAGFNNFYHKHHILSEADEQKRAFLLRLTELVEAQLVRALSLLESAHGKDVNSPQGVRWTGPPAAFSESGGE